MPLQPLTPHMIQVAIADQTAARMAIQNLRANLLGKEANDVWSDRQSILDTVRTMAKIADDVLLAMGQLLTQLQQSKEVAT